MYYECVGCLRKMSQVEYLNVRRPPYCKCGMSTIHQIPRNENERLREVRKVASE